MILVEKHYFGRKHEYFPVLDNITFLSKNLYNSTLYTVRQIFFTCGQYFNYNAVNAYFTDRNQKDYRALPAKVSKWTQMLVDQNFRSFFSLVKKKKAGNYGRSVRIPKYLDKVKGRQVAHYPKDALSFTKKGFVRLSKTNVYVKTDLDPSVIRYVKVVPENGRVLVTIGYEVSLPDVAENNRYASIDLGINNLAVVSSNVFGSFIVNGKPLKSMNQFANKLVAEAKSLLPKDVYSSNYINKIWSKRNNKIDDYIHKSTSFITNHLVFNDIGTLVIGYNKNWKQDVDLGLICNQKFVQIPFLKFVKQLEYKCAMRGIKVVRQEESYTSKCSFFDDEKICKHESYKGKRIERGLFRTGSGKLVNADLNGSLNILKKYLIKNEAWNDLIKSDLVEACSKPCLEVFSF